jgi:hypothetical protein
MNRPEIDVLVTYCNQNLGFTGASYEADNWRLLGNEGGTRYTYLDGNYVTDRRIAELFGKTPEVLSREPSGPAISFSVQTLEPLQVYVRSLRRRAKYAEGEPLMFNRWTAEL